MQHSKANGLQYVGDDDLIRSVFLQLLDGVAHIHSLGIAHRDIKPENIVCSDDGARVRICDFGLATAEVQSSEFGCGSTFYIAPECLGDWYPTRSSYPTKAGDVWSLGVILTNLVCGRNPWRIASPSDESFKVYLQDPSFLRRILPISEECLEILKGIFTVDPARRISLAELRKRVVAVTSFTMSEEEVVLAHAAAQVKQQQQAAAAQAHAHAQAQVQKARLSVCVTPVAEEDDQVQVIDWQQEDEIPFDLEDMEEEEDDKIPSLRADSGSPSPPTLRSRSSSSMGASLPPTPLLTAEDGVGGVTHLEPNVKPWDDLFKRPTSSLRIRERDLPTSPDVISVGGANPFFR